MSMTLADHIYQDRVWLTLNELDLPQKEGEVKETSINLDNEGIAKFSIHFERKGTEFLIGYQLTSEKPSQVIVCSLGTVIQCDLFECPAKIEVITGEMYFGKEAMVIRLVYAEKYVPIELHVWKEDIYKYFGSYHHKPSVCPNCGKPHNPNDECENENCEENPNPNEPFNPNDNPPYVWGYASEEIWDIEGYAGYNVPVFFRAYDDYGIYRFSYMELDEHETEGLQIIRDFKPEKVGDIAYRFNIFKELEGNYRYQIFVYDTANQKAESNVFNVTIKPALTSPIEPPIPPSVADSGHIILYNKKAIDFTGNGIGVLDNDVIDCVVDKQENGIYELTLKYLTTGKYVDELLDIENIIKCKSDISDSIAQLFRIYGSEYIMQDNVIIVKAHHISYDLKDALVENVNLIDVTCKQATQSLISRAIGNDKFVVNSDVEIRSNFSQQRVNVLEGIAGIENSIFDKFGGDNLVIDRNNFYYNINKKIDNDKGIIIAYSKNLLGFKRTINTEDVITGIYPYAHLRGGAVLRIKEKVIYSSNKDNYATAKIKAIDFTKETVVNEETLREEAIKYFENGCDIPKINYEVDFVNLYSNNALLKDKFRSLEEVVLGDTVTIQDRKIGISVKARVIRTIYNVVKKRYEKIELGNFKNEYRLSKKNDRNNLKKIVRSVID